MNATTTKTVNVIECIQDFAKFMNLDSGLLMNQTLFDWRPRRERKL